MVHGPLPVSTVELRIVQKFGAPVLTSEKEPFLKLVIRSSGVASGDAQDVR